MRWESEEYKEPHACGEGLCILDCLAESTYAKAPLRREMQRHMENIDVGVVDIAVTITRIQG